MAPEKAIRALRSIMTGACQFETLAEANARLMLIREVAKDVIEEQEPEQFAPKSSAGSPED